MPVGKLHRGLRSEKACCIQTIDVGVGEKRKERVDVRLTAMEIESSIQGATMRICVVNTTINDFKV